MEKLRKYIEIWYDGKEVRGIKNVAPYEKKMCAYIYDNLVAGNSVGIISSKIKEMLDKCGIRTEKEGIGWRCYND